jgi:hypothetical protein
LPPYSIAQIVVISDVPPFSPEEAPRVLRVERSDRDWADVRLSPPQELRLPRVRSTWRANEGSFGRFDDRLTRLDVLRRSRPPPLQRAPTIGQCWMGTPCIVGPPEVIVRHVR